MNVSEGYTALWERGRLDLTVEALIHDNPQWHPLFTPEELDICTERLTQYGVSRLICRIILGNELTCIGVRLSSCVASGYISTVTAVFECAEMRLGEVRGSALELCL